MYKNVSPNGCTYSDLFIYPSLKKVSPKEAMTKEWYVGCKFYDPTMQKKYPKGYFWRKKGLAEYKTYKEKVSAAKLLLDEMQRALDKSFNPIPSICKFQPIDEGMYSPDLYLSEALEMAFQDHKKNISKGYAISIKSDLKKVSGVIIKLRFEYIQIKNVELQHIKKILDNSNLSANSYNKCKKHLSVLFGILCANSCLVQNPCDYIPTKQHIKEERKVLTQKQFDNIYTNIVEKYPFFANYCQIFHMSGSRSTEMLNIKRKDVDLEKQEFIITVKKRNIYVREIRAIIPEALPFWEHQLDYCTSENDFLFGTGFKPELRLFPISRDRTSRYWKKCVKDGENGIDVDFYTLKHFFLRKVEEIHGLMIAQKMAGHLNGKTTEIYTLYKEKNELEVLKSLSLKKIEGA